jgi:hypothetical protein
MLLSCASELFSVVFLRLFPVSCGIINDIPNKRIETKVMKNEEQYDRIDSNIDNLLSEQEDMGAHHEYRIAKDIESKNQLDEKSRQLLGLDKETEDTTSEVIPVSDNPEHEMEAINDKWDELMWKEIGEDRPW